MPARQRIRPAAGEHFIDKCSPANGWFERLSDRCLV